MSGAGTTPHLGLGVGWRPELERAIAGADLGFVEVVAENVDPRQLPQTLVDSRARGLQVVPHGIGLSLGGGQRPDPGRLKHLTVLAERIGAPLVSEHIAFVRAEGVEAGHVMPVERTRTALEILTENVTLAQEALPVPLALEHVAAIVEWPAAELDEAAFVTELLERTGALLLFDVSNLYANAHNHGYDAIKALARFPLEQIAYVHVGGGAHRDGIYYDTHADPVVPEVLRLVEELYALADPPGVLLERDHNFPAEEELLGEIRAIGVAAARGAARHDPDRS